MRCFMVMLGLLLGGCATQPTGQRGGVATIGRAILSPFKAIGTKTVETVTPTNKTSVERQESPGDGSLASIIQPDNPAQTSAQNYDYAEDEELTFAQPTQITETTQTKEGATLTRKIEVPAGSKKIVKRTQKVGQSIGAAQKDTSRDTAAALASFQWVQWIGVAVILIGAVGFFHPVLRAALAGRDNAMALAGCGLVLVFGPYLFVAYAKWFVGALLLWAGFYCWNKYVHSKGQLDALKEKDVGI